MNYKNLVFDFGNVIGRFDGNALLGRFCPSPDDFDTMAAAAFANWPALDAGQIDYDENIEDAVSRLPERLRVPCRRFFTDWFQYVEPLPDTWEFIRQLKEKGCALYLLSNASARFARRALSDHPILNEFDGIVFSGPLKLVKPDPAIYRYLFSTFHLEPRECFFIDDTEENIIMGKQLGMDGIVFHGDLEPVKKAVGF